MKVLSTMCQIPCAFAMEDTMRRSVTVISGLAGVSTRIARTSSVMAESMEAMSEVST